MVTITVDQIEGWLRANAIAYQMVGVPPESSLTVASLFAPVDRGFYYFTGQTIPARISQSLFLVEHQSACLTCPDTNSSILVEANAQAVFYRLLGDLFGRSSNGQISKSAQVDPEAKIGKNVQLDPFCVIGKCEIGDDCIVGSHAVLHDNTIVDAASIIESHCDIGTQGVAWTWNEDQTEKIVQPQLGGVVIGQKCFIGAQTVVVRGSLTENTKIGDHSLLAPGSRIGHGTQIGDFVHFANNIVTGGNTKIGDHCFVGSAAVFRPQVKVHARTVVGAGAVVVKDTSAAGLTLVGVPARETETKADPSGMPKPKKG